MLFGSFLQIYKKILRIEMQVLKKVVKRVRRKNEIFKTKKKEATYKMIMIYTAILHIFMCRRVPIKNSSSSFSTLRTLFQSLVTLCINLCAQRH